MIDEKKLIEELYALADKEAKKCDEAAKIKLTDVVLQHNHGEFCYFNAVKTVNSQPQISTWILCCKRLPEEPEKIPTEDEPIEEMILDGKFKEYIVTIWGKDEATTLYYIGNNEWYDAASGESYYKVIAWQPLPERWS